METGDEMLWLLRGGAARVATISLATLWTQRLGCAFLELVKTGVAPEVDFQATQFSTGDGLLDRPALQQTDLD